MGHPARSLARTVGAGLALVAAVLIGSIALAPAAGAWHPEATATVGCTDDGVVLGWRTVSWGGDDFWGPNYYNSDIRVFVQYGTDDVALGGLTDQQVGSGAFTDQSLAFSGTTVLTPPAGATRVRVHAEAFAIWGSGNTTIPSVLQTTAWLALPAQCVEATLVTAPTTVPDTTTTSTTTAQVSNTNVTTGPGTGPTAAPVVAVRGATQVPGAPVVVAQSNVSTQTLPNTGSSTGVLAALAVVLLSVGAGLVAVSRRAEAAPPDLS